ncbi:hypothetical protein ATI61_107222 [Archangium gephyra]|uniref:Uncharacterized protein n=1 Tax=Archangium gephyra TaxID=48 RepID=A0AAC8QHG7_9BACT|nr:hypothetical protein [Archangium gephyra]AKJ07773.1 Hypothetical protein AA314_09399 [Archangium gephyra]REG29526.1 hypothetical protein ATI61_107222 [Archangium gephyra]
MSVDYEPISDWSPAGRSALVARRGAELRLLLDTAFTEFCDQQDLAAFGFHGDDPIAEAVEWCITGFVERDLDPLKLHAGSRSFRLFTEVAFWLSQKVGARALERLLRVRRDPANPEDLPGAEDVWDPPEAPASLRLKDLQERLARTLRELRHRTCADLVGYWLRGTQRLRARLFGWNEEAQVQHPATSKTRTSAHVHDARFRFQCLHQGLLQDAETHPELAATREMLFRPCANEVPYRRPARQVAQALPSGVAKGPREARRLCREGSALLVRALLTRFASIPEEGEERAEWMFGRQALAPMTLNALELEDREELRIQLQALPPPEALLQEAS